MYSIYFFVFCFTIGWLLFVCFHWSEEKMCLLAWTRNILTFKLAVFSIFMPATKNISFCQGPLTSGKVRNSLQRRSIIAGCGVNCPLLKGNQAPHPKFERSNGKNTKSKNFLKSVQNWCGELTWKLNEANSSKIWIESKQMKINDVFDCFTSKA